MATNKGAYSQSNRVVDKISSVVISSFMMSSADINNNKVSDTSSNMKKRDYEVSSMTENEPIVDFKIGSSNQQTDDVNGIENDLVIKNETLYYYYGELSSEVSIFRRATSELIDDSADDDDYCTCDDTSDDPYFQFQKKLTSQIDVFCEKII